MNSGQLVGSALLAAGFVLLVVGLGADSTLIDQLSPSLTPVYAASPEWYLISGLTAAATGALLALSPGR